MVRVKAAPLGKGGEEGGEEQMKGEKIEGKIRVRRRNGGNILTSRDGGETSPQSSVPIRGGGDKHQGGGE